MSQLLAPLTSGGHYEVHAVDRGDRALHLIRTGTEADLVILDAGISSPGLLDLCQTLKSDPQLSDFPVLVVDFAGTADDIALVNAGADDILKGAVTSETLCARAASLLRLRSLSEGIDDPEVILEALARAIEAKDPHTLGHADRVAQYAVQLGKVLGVSHSDAQTLRKGGMLHDIGKIVIPDSILLKPGRYSPEEFAVMKRHPTLGCEICGKLESVQDALPLIRHHHEKLDGSGYPDGLKGAEVSPLVRIVSLVDIYDALCSRRSYKDAYSIDKTFGIMWEEVQKGWWDKDILAAWESLIRSNKTVANAD